MSLKLRNWIKFVLRFENFAIFKQNYTLKVFIAFKMAHSWCFSLGENLDFLDILQKKFYNINKGSHSFFSSTARQLLNCPPFQKLSFKCSPFFPQIPSTFCVCSNHIRFWHPHRSTISKYWMEFYTLQIRKYWMVSLAIAIANSTSESIELIFVSPSGFQPVNTLALSDRKEGASFYNFRRWRKCQVGRF